MLALILIPIMWTDGHTGERIGEADNPGHRKRGPRRFNQRAIPAGIEKEHIWLRLVLMILTSTHYKKPTQT